MTIPLFTVSYRLRLDAARLIDAAADTGPRKQEIVVNEANWERIGRLAVGVVLLILGFTALNGIIAVIAVIAGLILTVTGAVGWCPIYSVLKIGTRKITGA